MNLKIIELKIEQHKDWLEETQEEMYDETNNTLDSAEIKVALETLEAEKALLEAQYKKLKSLEEHCRLLQSDLQKETNVDNKVSIRAALYLADKSLKELYKEVV